MPESRYSVMMIMSVCMVILLCTAAGCFNFSPMIPGGGQGGGDGSGGAGAGAGPAGGTSPGDGGSGGSAGSGCSGLTPMHTYFTVRCQYHSELKNPDWGSETEDITVSGDIPIEMVREWDTYGLDSFSSQGGKLNYQYSSHRICGRLEENCGDCKYTYSGPAFGGVEIDKESPVSTRDWTANFWFEGQNYYSNWISQFDPNNFAPFDCPPRLGWYSVTGGAGPKIAPDDVQQVLPACTEDMSPDHMNQMVENAIKICEPVDPSTFILRDGEVITYKNVDDGGINIAGVSTVDATYTFHISAR